MADRRQHDVAIVGAGMAGLAACILLRMAGLDVVCLDAQAYPHHKVGESLDWSSPGLLARLGLTVDELLAAGIATYKRKIVVFEGDHAPWTAAPPPVIRRSPLRFETVTLHVDRTALDARLYERAAAEGTAFVWERVATVEHDGDRVVACTTSGGTRVEARWFLDASGTARAFSRAMNIPITSYGRPKVCLWTYFDTPPLEDGTAFFVDNRHEYLRWVWDIPISPSRTSVGFVLPAVVVRDRRRAGDSLDAILRGELQRYRRFDALLAAAPALDVESTSFQPYVTDRVCGTNWLMVGEAASMPDPLTGNGVTSGIRHARHAVAAILASGSRHALSRSQQRAYTRHVLRLGHAFNAHIERAIYGPRLRHGLGLQAATYIYTAFAFFMNALHARFDPRGPAGMAVFAALFAAVRGWVACWSAVARVALWRRNTRPGRVIRAAR